MPLLITFLLVLPVLSHAVTIELDLAVKESIEKHFQDYNRKVDLNKLEYYGEPQTIDNLIRAETSIWAERGFSQKWGWHICTTELQILDSQKFIDLGSSCYFQFD